MVEAVVPFFRLLGTPLFRFLFPRLLFGALELWGTGSLRFFEGVTEGEGDLVCGEPGSVRGESPENKASISDFPLFSRRELQRTSPTGAFGVFTSRAWLGLGGTFDGLMRGAGSMNTASGDLVPLGGVLCLSDWVGVGRIGSTARVAGCGGAKEP